MPRMDNHQCSFEDFHCTRELAPLCAQIVLKNACTWPEVVDLIYCGQPTSRDQSPSGTVLVAEGWHD